MQARFKEIFKKTVRALESDAKTHRTPKALRAKSIGKRLLFFAEAFGVRTRPRVALGSGSMPPCSTSPSEADGAPACLSCSLGYRSRDEQNGDRGASEGSIADERRVRGVYRK